ncbi:hypothetical protein LSAT2_003222, partial [Lamellibrachia satsuma]
YGACWTSCGGRSAGQAVMEGLQDKLWWKVCRTSCGGRYAGQAVVEGLQDKLWWKVCRTSWGACMLAQRKHNCRIIYG